MTWWGRGALAPARFLRYPDMTTTTLPRAPARSAVASVTGETYSRLINLSGRRRFTSQRIVLFAVLASHGEEDALEASREALNIFLAAHQALTQPGDGLPGLFCPELREAHHGTGGHERVIQDFVQLARKVHAVLADPSRNPAAVIGELVKASTPVLASVNALTQVYEDLGRRQARRERERLAGLLGDIQGISQTARIVSFNAQVVAARAGGNGREFAVVASELLRITSQIDALVQEAVRTAES